MKRAQVTLFVILGLAVLLVVAIAIYISSTIKVEQVDVEEKFKEDYDAKLQPLADDVKFCLSSLAEEALLEIGVHGGYMNTSGYRTSMFNEYDNTAVEFFEGSGLTIPYWIFIDGSPDCRQCVVRTNMPLLEGPASIQEDVQSHIDANIKECMNDFGAYANQFDVVAGDPKSEVVFRDDDVFIGLEWPLNVSFNDRTSFTMTRFGNTLDVPFRRIFWLANDILFQLEMFGADRRLEFFTLNIIDYLGLGGKNAAIPPREGPIITEIEAPRIWNLDDVKSTLKTAITENMPYVQVTRSRDSFYPFTEDPYKDNIYGNFQQNVYTDEEYMNRAKVDFYYSPDWPFYLRVSPSAGPIIMPDSSIMNLLFIQLAYARYRFYYDVSYPVVVSIEDNAALDGKGYRFQYAFEVNLRNNKPYTNETIFLNSTVSLDENSTGFSDYRQRTVPVTLKVKNGYTTLPEKGVSVSFTCADQSLFIGTSEMKGSEAVIETMLPPCLGGYFAVFGQKYAANNLYADLAAGQQRALEYTVFPERQFKVYMKRKLFVPTVSEVEAEIKAQIEHEIGKDRNWILLDGENQVSDIETDEEVILLLNEIREGQESSNIKFLLLNATDMTGYINITPGTYKVSVISLMHFGENYSRDKLVIPPRHYTVPAGFLGLGSEDVDLPVVEFNDSLLFGGLLYDNTTSGYLQISIDDLALTNTLTFYYAGYNLDDLDFVQDLKILQNLTTSTITHPDAFKPKYEREQ